MQVEPMGSIAVHLFVAPLAISVPLALGHVQLAELHCSCISYAAVDGLHVQANAHKSFMSLCPLSIHRRFSCADSVKGSTVKDGRTGGLRSLPAPRVNSGKRPSGENSNGKITSSYCMQVLRSTSTKGEYIERQAPFRGEGWKDHVQYQQQG